ncbi:histidine kinase [Thiohalocapsa halophila]|uniref:Histidine kinase n=1 Tax=Thiohalocapsa halophila TaxID=69359 RepID=A0ABS1CJV8_9GAMM|nr:GAF domain-containing protein [Thiohalocapsa halophila]MBK1632185.1 histidine kinase [Thiohalocapsa halophila]
MSDHAAANPAFGRADLSNCEREQIHLAGSIQPNGALLLLREPDLVVVQSSANAGSFLGCRDGVIGASLADLGGDLEPLVRSHAHERLDAIPAAVRCRVDGLDAALDGTLHRPAGGGLILELEIAGPASDLSGPVCDALSRISASNSLDALCGEAAAIFKELAGYDRVMVYRFDEDGHGEVLAERREAHLEAYLGNRYPASDIPQMARRLYMRNRVRVLVDVAYAPVPLTPALSPISGAELDMSLCCLRSMSPIHIQYLKNMGVSATLVASLLVGGRLWGLIACHHYSARQSPYQTRVACELLAEAVSTRIAALESFAQSYAELSVRRLEQRMVEAVSTNGDWEGALFDDTQAMQSLKAGGIALLRDGEAVTAGEVPGTQQLREIAAWLDAQPRAPVHATASLPSEDPKFAALTEVAAGLIAAPISAAPGEYLIWFRPERVRTLTWGGNPFKAVEIGDDPSQLSPRQSFAKWYQVVEGTCDPWSDCDKSTARLIGESVADVIQQFRSVRVLIAKQQLEQIKAAVRHCDQPVVIVTAAGEILQTNAAFDGLVPQDRAAATITDMLGLFSDPAEAGRQIEALREQGRPWRGEVLLDTADEDRRPFRIRADPVLSTPNQLLGFVFLFNDLRERKAADEARQRFQVEVLGRHRMLSLPLDTAQDLRYRDLLNSLLGNAQLAALEITENLDMARVPEMLESVQSSVSRTTELLEHLKWYANHIGPHQG